MYAQVIIDANHAEVDRVFDYRVPAQWEEAVCVGLRVMVPFGQRNTKREGYVIALTETTEVPAGKIKEIVEILDEGRPILTPPILELAKWMKKEYFCTLNQCLQAVMPAGIRTKSVWYVELTEQTAELSASTPRTQAASFAVSSQYFIPSSPVHAFAMPEFTITACGFRFDSTIARSHFTGAAFTRFVVKVPAALHGFSL